MAKKFKSILQTEKECYLCRMEAEKIGYYGQLPNTGLQIHHFMHGTANRQLAERYGLYAYVCQARHHTYGPEAPHSNPEVDRQLQQIAQREFEKKYSHEEWMRVFIKNYLD